MKPPSQTVRLAAVEKQLAQIVEDQAQILADQAAAATEREKLLGMVTELHDALLRKQPGQSESLLNRMAAVTINIESGERIGRILVWLAGVLAAVGAVIAAMKWGGPTR